MSFELARTIEILERTPDVLASLLTGLSDEWLLGNEGDETFSPRDVLGHLITGEESDWLVRTEVILRHGTSRPFEPFDRFRFRKHYEAHSLEELLARFRELRADNLARLRELALTPEQLERKGRHPELGEVSLRQLLATWAVHDLGHLRQIARVLAKQYRDAVGPWKQYLPVLDE